MPYIYFPVFLLPRSKYISVLEPFERSILIFFFRQRPYAYPAGKRLRHFLCFLFILFFAYQEKIPVAGHAVQNHRILTLHPLGHLVKPLVAHNTVIHKKETAVFRFFSARIQHRYRTAVPIHIYLVIRFLHPAEYQQDRNNVYHDNQCPHSHAPAPEHSGQIHSQHCYDQRKQRIRCYIFHLFPEIPPGIKRRVTIPRNQHFAPGVISSKKHSPAFI